jgi:hypothetical protein
VEAALQRVFDLENEGRQLRGGRRWTYSQTLEDLNRTLPLARHRLHVCGLLARHGAVQLDAATSGAAMSQTPGGGVTIRAE